mgnify:CR=1 FL=1
MITLDVLSHEVMLELSSLLEANHPECVNMHEDELFADKGLDSIDMSTILMEIESKYDLTLSTKHLLGITCQRDFVKIMSEAILEKRNSL